MRIGPATARINATGCIVLPVALFIGLMLATAGTAIWPPMAAPGAALLCRGEVVYRSHGASYRPGEYIVTRDIHCATGDGKTGEESEITLSAIGLSFLLYAALSFLLLRFVALLLLRRRLARLFASPAAPIAEGQPAGLQDILAKVSDAMRSGRANVVVRNVGMDAMSDDEGDDIAGRLARLRSLYDRGLVTAADYEAKRAEILSRL